MDLAHQSMGSASTERYLHPDVNAGAGGLQSYLGSPGALFAFGLFVLLLITRAASSQRPVPKGVNDEGVARPPAVP